MADADGARDETLDGELAPPAARGAAAAGGDAAHHGDGAALEGFDDDDDDDVDDHDDLVRDAEDAGVAAARREDAARAVVHRGVSDDEDDEDDVDDDEDDDDDSPFAARGLGGLDAELGPGMRRRQGARDAAADDADEIGGGGGFGEDAAEGLSDEEFFAQARARRQNTGDGARTGPRPAAGGRVQFDLGADDSLGGEEYVSPRQAAWEAQLGGWGHSMVMFASIGIGLYVASKVVNIDFVRFLGMVFLGGLGMLAARPSYNPRLSTMIEHNLSEAELETIRTFVQRRVDLHDAPGAARDEYLGRLKRSSVGRSMSSMGPAGASRSSGLYTSASAAGYPSNYVRYSSGGLGPVPENEDDLFF